MMTRIISALIALGLVGCGHADPTAEDLLIVDAKTAIAATLKDPDSAKFRGIKAYPAKGLVCGEVNGKNSYGAYSGFSPFFYDDGFAQIADVDGLFRPRYDELCIGAIREEGLAALDKTEKLIAEMEDGPEKEKIRSSVVRLRAEQSEIDKNREKSPPDFQVAP